jgi:hypothetical protein
MKVETYRQGKMTESISNGYLAAVAVTERNLTVIKIHDGAVASELAVLTLTTDDIKAILSANLENKG